MSRINNGRPSKLAFDFFTGDVRLIERGGRLEFAFVTRRPPPEIDARGTVDGESHRVVAAAPSKLVNGMMLVTLEPVQ